MQQPVTHRMAAALVAAIMIAPCPRALGNQGEIGPGTEREQQAMALVQLFAGRLKPRLKQALSEGGPVHAIEVCSRVAPEIAVDISEQSGWQVTRVSTKNRNPAAAPDAWEAAAIETFEKQLAGGADPGALQMGEITADGYRFAKAQITEPLCLMCHGQSIAPDVAKALEAHYPGDRATGYEAGDIRGIFSLVGPK